MIDLFLQASALGISAALSPGPFQSLIIAESLLGGWRRALPVLFAPLIADIPIAIVLVFVLKQVPDTFLQYIRFAGAALLLYLAWNLWRQVKSSISPERPQSPAPPSIQKGLTMGVAMLFLSPGPYLYWSLILGPLLLTALGLSLLHAFVFLFAFYLFSIGGLFVISVLLTRAGEISPTWKKRLQFGSLFLMLVIALFLIVGDLPSPSGIG
jgi:threonine/homoserine/homoserine lactone efflux protein